ncbi:unnamed protein product [Rotaria socialis]|uniref:Uncharacterized protein n=1 Tax=Rotaria socialis TaxID=392032 RepID=A0A821SI37_9BILA|nr:unnamed protein product [Rotaria socialis]CAF4318800.1 unnamed protein product [Rotaria socialis]CAF4860135.1 unnamed protein product [Rotaria socialis]
MTRRFKTKLLKIVIKRSELMHDRFRGSSWTSKISQTDKKSLFANKTGEKFRSKLLKISVAKTWPSIQKVCIIEKDVLRPRIFLTNDYIQFLNKKKGMDRCQTSSTDQTMRTMLMWTSKFEVRYVFKK